MQRRRCCRAGAALVILTMVLSLLYWYETERTDQRRLGPMMAPPPPRMDPIVDDDSNEQDESAISISNQLELLKVNKLADETKRKLAEIRQPRQPHRRTVHEFGSDKLTLLGSKLNESSLLSHSTCTAQEEYESLTSDVTVKCSRWLRLGLESDGGWYTCSVGPYKLNPDNCVVLSFGVGQTWKFDDEAATRARCRVFTFDPSVKGPAERDSGVRFFRLGVAGSRGRHGNWTVDTIDNFIKRLLKQRTIIDLLKLDVEHAEWEALEASSDAALSRVKQLVLELHTQELWPGRSTSSGQYRRYSRLLRRLRSLGFRIWLSQPNWAGKFYSADCNWRTTTCCRNVHFVNVNFLSNAAMQAPLRYEIRDLRVLTGRTLPTLPTPLTPEAVEATFFDVVKTDSAVCKTRRRIGPERDGGYDLCFANSFALKRDCRVYSFGVGRQFEFEDSLANKFNCRVRMFDPSMSTNAHKRSLTEWFHPIGIGARDERRSNGWTVRTLSTLLGEFEKEETVIDVLKIDVDFDEWEALEAAVRDASLKRVKQLVLETHTREVSGGRSSTAEFLRLIGIWYDLHRLGFRQWRHSENRRITFRGADGVLRPCCHEHSLLNSNFID